MQKLLLEVTQDHVDRLARAKRPIHGVAELIWNSVDADATEVEVRLNRNALNVIESIEVQDNGSGISLVEAQDGFGHLGGSWKQQQRQSKRDKRMLHGKQGQGRFRAFALAERVEWQSVWLSEGQLKRFNIVGNSDNKREFIISDESSAVSASGPGTTVILSNIVTQQNSLDADKAIPELDRQFAIYLNQYPQVRLSYDGQLVDPSALEKKRSTYQLPTFTTEDGSSYDVLLTIIEWTLESADRALYLCDAEGFTLRELPPGIHAPGYRFTAYLRSKLLEE